MADLDQKMGDVREVFTLLEAQETSVTEEITTLIHENLNSKKESWLVHSLVDYFYMTQSTSVADILCKVQDPHDKHLLEKLCDGIKSQDHQLPALQLLLYAVCKQPHWLIKIVNMSVLKVIIKSMKVETNIPVLMTAVTVVTILLPSIPTLVGPYLPDLFEVFNRLASFTVKKPPGNTPDIFYLHLQIAVYALFHRLYGMFPYNFLTYLRHYYSKKDNTLVFDEAIKCMLERVRLHPALIIGTKEQETSTQRWKHMETHDIVVECNKMSLDPIEGTWEELQCPIIKPSHMIDRLSANRMRLPRASAPVSLSLITVPEGSPLVQSQDMFWSPSEVIGLSTPPHSLPNTPAMHVFEASGGGAISGSHTPYGGIVTGAQIGANLSINVGTTPMNTPRETPPISEEADRSRANSRGPSRPDPKRLSCEFPTNQQVPLLTPLSNIPSVPPSPLRAEFTNTPPIGVKPLPILQAARELQFDSDLTYEHSKKHLSQVETLKSMSDGKDNVGIRQGQGASVFSTGENSKTPSRSSSATFFEDSLKITADLNASFEKSSTHGVQDAINSSQEVKEGGMSNASSGGQMDTVCIDNISQVIESLESNDEDDDDEVSELTSVVPGNQTVTAESVKKFMKSVNRIRFNSLTATNNIELNKSNKPFGAQKRSRSCPQFPKIASLNEDDDDEEEDDELSRSASTTCKGPLSSSLVTSDQQDGMASSKPVTSFVSMSQPASLQGISVSNTSTVTVHTRQETQVTVTTTQQSQVTVTPCHMSARVGGVSHQSTADQGVYGMLKQLLNLPAANVCTKCGGKVQDNQSETAPAFFTTYSPPELLDRHIELGRDIHAKELSKIPMPSTTDTNWTHFGGVPPADEISILRGQLTLLHNQVMYERHKRDQHAKRNRRLLRKIAHTNMLEEQNAAMTDQLQQKDHQLKDQELNIKLLETENGQLKAERDSETFEKHLQLNSCLRENEELKNAKKEFNTLLVRQREEQDKLEQRLMEKESHLFNTTKELEKMAEVTQANAKLKEQVLQLQKELVLMGELQHKSSEKLLAYKASKASHLEHKHIQAGLQQEIHTLKKDLSVKSTQLEGCQAQLRDQMESLTSKEEAMSQMKLLVDKVKARHSEELQSVEEKHQASLRVNQALESHILQLYSDLELSKAQLDKGSPSRQTSITPGFEPPLSPAQEDEQFRERTNSDPLRQQPSFPTKQLTRMASLPVSGEISISGVQKNTGLDYSHSQSQRSASDKHGKFPLSMTEEEDFEIISGAAARQQKTPDLDIGSVSSREASLLPGQRNYTSDSVEQ
ncbi:hamartin-like [Mya arenaria]|uniref:hamartin-like n=1 Tax=Mya arenaria TaxID=6604 RepID=UPI0022E1B676|nr:hamartin-like [Mya arenaria]XP_052789918.1 hamartin-like [Mya arenaria]